MSPASCACAPDALLAAVFRAASSRVRRSTWAAPAALGGLILLLQLGGAPLRAALRYERAAVLGGQAWRLLTAHLVHLGWTHCLMNLAAFALCVWLARGERRGRFWWVASAALGLAIGTLLLLAAPEVADYAGLSGVVYGLFVCVLAPQARQGDRVAGVLLVLVLARIGWQLVIDDPAAPVALIGGVVIAKAHAFGAGCAAAWVVAREWQARRRGRAGPQA